MFLQTLYRRWRGLFWVLLLLIAAQLFFMAKGIENIPFFLYNMYSQPHHPKDSATVYLIKTNTGYSNTKAWSNRQEELLMNSAGYWLTLLQKGDATASTVQQRLKGRLPEGWYNFIQKGLVNDSVTIAAFPGWWARYFTAQHSAVGPVQLVQTTVSLRPPYGKSFVDSILFTTQP